METEVVTDGVGREGRRLEQVYWGLPWRRKRRERPQIPRDGGGTLGSLLGRDK